MNIFASMLIELSVVAERDQRILLPDQFHAMGWFLSTQLINRERKKDIVYRLGIRVSKEHAYLFW